MAFSQSLLTHASQVLAECRNRGLKVATAESCTGGLIAGVLTEVAGASDVMDCGFIAYSNKAKQDILGVEKTAIEKHGAVSEEVARQMADGALARSDADLAISVTGIAGPGGGTADKPVGLVWFGLAHRGGRTMTEERRFGDIGRHAIRIQTVEIALSFLTPPD